MISDESGSWCPEINGKLNISSFHDKKIEEKPCSAHLKNSHISAECSMQVPKLWFWAHISSSLIIIIINGTWNIATTLMLLKIQILFFFWSCNYLRNFSLIYPTFSSFCFFRHKITVLIFFFFGMHLQRLKSSEWVRKTDNVLDTFFLKIYFCTKGVLHS